MFVYIFSPLYQLSTSTLSVNRGGRRVFVIALHFRDFIFSFCQWWRLIGNCHRDLPMHCHLVTDHGHEIGFLGFWVQQMGWRKVLLNFYQTHFSWTIPKPGFQVPDTSLITVSTYILGLHQEEWEEVGTSVLYICTVDIGIRICKV